MPTKKTSTKKTPAKKTTKTAAKKVVKKTAAKKPVKKTATKKTAAKKPTTRKKTTTKKPAKDLVYAPDEKSFWTTDGEILNSLVALADAFDQMPKSVYTFHAGGEQNDFVVWVDSVLCDGECATALGKAKTPKSAKTVVVRHLKLYAV